MSKKELESLMRGASDYPQVVARLQNKLDKLKRADDDESDGDNDNNNKKYSSSQQLLSSLEPGKRNVIIANRLRWYGTYQTMEKEAKLRRIVELNNQKQKLELNHNNNSPPSSSNNRNAVSRAAALAEVMKMKEQQKLSLSDRMMMSSSSGHNQHNNNNTLTSPKLKPSKVHDAAHDSLSANVKVFQRKPTWVLDPKSRKWIKNSSLSNSNSNDDTTINNKSSQQQRNRFPVENPQSTINWSFSDAEFDQITQRLRAGGETFDLNIDDTRQLFRLVSMKYGAKFFVISDRWFFEEDGNAENVRTAEQEELYSEDSLYRHYCLFISTLGEIRREALTLVLEAALKNSSKKDISNSRSSKKKDNSVTASSTPAVVSSTAQQVASALLREHPQLRNTEYFITSKAELENRRKFLEERLDDVAEEDCIGGEFFERINDIQHQSAILSAKCEVPTLFVDSSTEEHQQQDENNTNTTTSLLTDDISHINSEAEKAAAMTLLFAEQRRHFAFLPGTLRSAIDDYIFLDLPAGSSGSSTGGGGGIMSNQMMMPPSSTNKNSATNQQYHHQGTTTTTTVMNTNTTKAHKDLEDFLERHLQSFVPAASDEIMKRIDALRAIVAATTVVDRENSRIKSFITAMKKLTNETEQLKDEVLAEKPKKRQQQVRRQRGE